MRGDRAMHDAIEAGSTYSKAVQCTRVFFLEWSSALQSHWQYKNMAQILTLNQSVTIFCKLKNIKSDCLSNYRTTHHCLQFSVQTWDLNIADINLLYTQLSHWSLGTAQHHCPVDKLQWHQYSNTTNCFGPSLLTSGTRTHINRSASLCITLKHHILPGTDTETAVDNYLQDAAVAMYCTLICMSQRAEGSGTIRLGVNLTGFLLYWLQTCTSHYQKSMGVVDFWYYRVHTSEVSLHLSLKSVN